MLTRALESVQTMPSTEVTPAGVHVLAIDDDPSVRQMIADYLGDNDIRVTVAGSGKEIAEVMARDTIDLLILDLKMPGEDGMQIARNLRAESDIPIIILTGRKDEADRVMGLELGADDYLTKPFSVNEFEARVRALLRRNVAPPLHWSVGGLSIDRAAKRVRIHDKPVDLTPREWALLELFLTRPGRVLSKEQIGESLFNVDGELSPNAIEVHVSRLRTKIESSAVRIRTVRGFGYLWEGTDE
jgi:two-component system, OmpR family, response regulator